MGFLEVSYYYPNFISLFDHFSIGNRNINVGSGLHLELLHGLLGLGNVKLVIVAAHLNSLLMVVFRERTPVFGENRLFLSAGIACVVFHHKFPAFSGKTGEEWKQNKGQKRSCLFPQKSTVP